ncbi:MAG: hypothetical protein K2W95_08535 [Candidatus Obscuribacterales bacterium]|nr:hypothetical protein [Candidatus Obscuribacterales bacterium]
MKTIAATWLKICIGPALPSWLTELVARATCKSEDCLCAGQLLPERPSHLPAFMPTAFEPTIEERRSENRKESSPQPNKPVKWPLQTSRLQEELLDEVFGTSQTERIKVSDERFAFTNSLSNLVPPLTPNPIQHEAQQKRRNSLAQLSEYWQAVD